MLALSQGGNGTMPVHSGNNGGPGGSSGTAFATVTGNEDASLTIPAGASGTAPQSTRPAAVGALVLGGNGGAGYDLSIGGFGGNAGAAGARARFATVTASGDGVLGLLALAQVGIGGNGGIGQDHSSAGPGGASSVTTTSSAPNITIARLAETRITTSGSTAPNVGAIAQGDGLAFSCSITTTTMNAIGAQNISYGQAVVTSGTHGPTAAYAPTGTGGSVTITSSAPITTTGDFAYGTCWIKVSSASFTLAGFTLSSARAAIAGHLQSAWKTGGSHALAPFFALFGNTAALGGPGPHASQLQQLSPDTTFAPGARQVAGAQAFAKPALSGPAFEGTTAMPVEGQCVWARVMGRTANQGTTDGVSCFRVDINTWQIGGQPDLGGGGSLDTHRTIQLPGFGAVASGEFRSAIVGRMAHGGSHRTHRKAAPGHGPLETGAPPTECPARGLCGCGTMSFLGAMKRYIVST